MYIHIGGDVSLLKKNVVAIFDMDNTTISGKTREFLSLAEDDGILINVSDELPRTFIIENYGKGKTKIYLSPVSSATLLKRAEERGTE